MPFAKINDLEVLSLRLVSKYFRASSKTNSSDLRYLLPRRKGCVHGSLSCACIEFVRCSDCRTGARKAYATSLERLSEDMTRNLTSGVGHYPCTRVAADSEIPYHYAGMISVGYQSSSAVYRLSRLQTGVLSSGIKDTAEEDQAQEEPSQSHSVFPLRSSDEDPRMHRFCLVYKRTGASPNAGWRRRSQNLMIRSRRHQNHHSKLKKDHSSSHDHDLLLS
ncbi:hypothetical protein KCU81_g447, partial [Aureobasidium melanogenum]